MRRIVGCMLGLLLATVVAGADEAKDKTAPQGSVARQFEAIKKDWDAKLTGFRKELREAKTDEERQKIQKQAVETLTQLPEQAIALAEKNPKDASAGEVLVWALSRTRTQEGQGKIMGILSRDQVENKAIGPVCLTLANLPLPEVEKFLKAVAEKNPSPEAKGLASLGLAAQVLGRADEAEGPEAAKIEKEAEKLLLDAVAKYGDVKTEGGTVGSKARAWLGLFIGQVAPEISGEDGDEKKFKLSEYRGKVVMIDFWAGWCGPCMGLVPHNRALVKKMEGKPFVLLGVNEDKSKEELKRVANDAQINWRSFFDEGGKIAQDWRIRGFPTMLVLDHKGVMRFKIVGGGADNAKAVEEAVEKLVKEAEAEKGQK